MTTKEILQGIKSWVTNFFARKDGSYEQMISGAAMNLAGQTVEVNSEMYHPTGVEHASGVAEVRNIKGNTVAWNQHIEYGNTTYYDYVAYYGSKSVNNNICTYTLNELAHSSSRLEYAADKSWIIRGHVFYLSAMINPVKDTTVNFYITSLGQPTRALANTWSRANSVLDVDAQTRIEFGFYLNLGRDLQEGDTCQIKEMMAFDLTLIYGAGNEPSTPEQFEADYFKWFGKPLTYEEYDEGSLRSVNMSAYKTVGFNQWDEEWELGNYSSDTGGKVDSDTQIRCKNLIPVFPSTNYYFKVNNNIRLRFYRKDGSYIGYQGQIIEQGVFTTPSDCAFITFFCAPSYGTTYNHDICINISNAERNGEYEPYEAHNYPMSVTTMKGKLNGEGASVVVFPDGMRSAGTIHDEIFISGGKTYGIRRVGSVDLGTIGDWYISTGESSVFRCFVTMRRGGSPYLVCPIYDNFGIVGNVGSLVNMQIGSHGANSVIFIKNTSYTDVATFRAAMQGVMLHYELETPEIYEIDDFSLPQNILVDSDGTEEVLNAQGKEDESVAPYIDMIYSINAVGALNNLPKGYISEKSMDNFLARLSSAMGGTWTKTWNSTLKEWEFSFQSSQVTSTNISESDN